MPSPVYGVLHLVGDKAKLLEQASVFSGLSVCDFLLLQNTSERLCFLEKAAECIGEHHLPRTLALHFE
jgi:hypothetical protein